MLLFRILYAYKNYLKMEALAPAPDPKVLFFLGIKTTRNSINNSTRGSFFVS
jgi:hypothetical protein